MYALTDIICLLRVFNLVQVFEKTFLQYYKSMHPFGNGNPEPVFVLKNPKFVDTGTIKNHLTYTLKINNQVFRGIGFGMADKLKLLRSNSVQLAFKIKSTVYKGEHRIEMHIVELLPSV